MRKRHTQRGGVERQTLRDRDIQTEEKRITHK